MKKLIFILSILMSISAFANLSAKGALYYFIKNNTDSVLTAEIICDTGAECGYSGNNYENAIAKADTTAIFPILPSGKIAYPLNPNDVPLVDPKSIVSYDHYLGSDEVIFNPFWTTADVTTGDNLIQLNIYNKKELILTMKFGEAYIEDNQGIVSKDSQGGYAYETVDPVIATSGSGYTIQKENDGSLFCINNKD